MRILFCVKKKKNVKILLRKNKKKNVAPSKPRKNCEQLVFSTSFVTFSESVRVHLNASRCIQIHPNAFERIWTGPSESEQVRKLKEICEDLKHFPKN